MTTQNIIIALSLQILLALVFHASLMPFTLTGTYDAYIHMFFGQHYNTSWFDPWEPRWYTGFSTTSYPPATHMLQGLLQHFMAMKTAFVVTMSLGLITLIIGYYRFSRIWVSEQAAIISGFLLVFSSAITQTIHVFGQLPTIWAMALLLNATPHVYRWMTKGKLSQLLLSVLMAAATTSAHHVTTIFGAMFFIGALCLLAYQNHLTNHWATSPTKRQKITVLMTPVFRGGILAVLMIFAVVITVFPYWYWSFTDPITQVPIPHGTRENFLERKDLGYVFFIVPWGMTLTFLPYAAYKSLTTRIWPLGMMLFLCLLLGTGGTTPLPRLMLGPAFDILTLDRFTFWGTMLALPFLGHMFLGLFNGQSGKFMTALFGGAIQKVLTYGSFGLYGIVAAFIGLTSTYQSLQPNEIDPYPIVNFMETDEHDRWRYLTLGFGDQFAYVSAYTRAQSVDGNYHSARRLPELTSYSVERLENSKYRGIAGLGSLQQFLVSAERYSLKYVFANDRFYDPLLYFTGWNAIQRLPNNIVVWEKPNVTPLPLVTPRKSIPFAHRMMWSFIPIIAFFTGLTILAFSTHAELKSRRYNQAQSVIRPRPKNYKNVSLIRNIIFACLIAFISAGGYLVISAFKRLQYNPPPEIVIENYFRQLDWRQFDLAYEKLDPKHRPSYSAFYFERMWDGGLVNSFGKLQAVEKELLVDTPELKSWEVKTMWLTALGNYTKVDEIDTVKHEGKWYLVSRSLQARQTLERIQSRETAVWNVVGRRQPRFETDLHRDRPDRPNFAVSDARIIKYDGQVHTVGSVMNLDADPMAVTLQSLLMNDAQDELARASGGLAAPHRVMPLEQSGFRIEQEGVLSLDDAKNRQAFDPELFVPPEFEEEPTQGRLLSSSVSTDTGIYRDYLVSNIRSEMSDDGHLRITGNVQNTGLETLITVKILITAYDLDQRVIWVQPAYTETVIRTGQTASFTATLPKRNEIEILSELDENQIGINNGLKSQTELIADGAQGTISIDNSTGYSSFRLYLDSMVYDEVF